MASQVSKRTSFGGGGGAGGAGAGGAGVGFVSSLLKGANSLRLNSYLVEIGPS